MVLFTSRNLHETSSKFLQKQKQKQKQKRALLYVLLFHQNHKCTDLLLNLFGAVSQSYLKFCLPYYSPHFAPNKT